MDIADFKNYSKTTFVVYFKLAELLNKQQTEDSKSDCYNQLQTELKVPIICNFDTVDWELLYDFDEGENYFQIQATLRNQFHVLATKLRDSGTCLTNKVIVSSYSLHQLLRDLLPIAFINNAILRSDYILLKHLMSFIITEDLKDYKIKRYKTDTTWIRSPGNINYKSPHLVLYSRHSSFRKNLYIHGLLDLETQNKIQELLTPKTATCHIIPVYQYANNMSFFLP